mmetsp:Transcript_18425/g.38709  ORF Transcript_18425/g.38709 Transcript_18425/m.38709 type:complete len:125 (-) Transcript_18425:64-438(-)
MTRNISLAILEISEPGPVSSSRGISALGARRDGWGYLRTRRSVPSTTPGSTSSVVLKRAEVMEEMVGDGDFGGIPLLCDEEYVDDDRDDSEDVIGRDAACRATGVKADVCLINVQSAVVAMGVV